MKLYSNGIIIQELSHPTNFVTDFNYEGLNAYYQDPLSCLNNAECKKLSRLISYRSNEDGTYTPLEFVASTELAVKYIAQCRKMNLSMRVLFVESEYGDEVWDDVLPQMQFLGYEYSPIPLDSQVVTDFCWYKPLQNHVSKLNGAGLFRTLEDVSEFKAAYDYAVLHDNIGDDTKSYICKVSEVILT